MPDLTPGIYEQLVTNELQRRLESVDPSLVDRGPLDVGDAHEILARHLAILARRALLSVPGADSEALARQVVLANQIAEAILAVTPGSGDDGDLIAQTKDLLQAI